MKYITINWNSISYSKYVKGSLFPLLISNIDVIESFKFNSCERSIENTNAASVDATIEPIRRLSNHVVF